MTAFTSTLTDAINPHDGNGLGILLDGLQNYLDLGTLGSFGSNLVNGLHIKFQIQTTQTTSAEFGRAAGNGRLTVGLNQNMNGVAGPGKLKIYIADSVATSLIAGVDSNTGFNDGRIHTIEIDANMSTKTVTILVDGSSKTITYNTRNQPSNFANFTTSFTIGTNLAAIIDNFRMGTSPNTLYASYDFNDGTNPTTDGSGNGNNATLQGSLGIPLFVLGLDTMNKDSTKSVNLSLSLIETLSHVGTFSRSLTDSVALSDSLTYIHTLYVSLYEKVRYSYLLLENGFYLLQENGAKMLLEGDTVEYPETLARANGKFITNSVVLTERLTRALSRIVRDSISIGDAFVEHLRRGRLFRRLGQLFIAGE